MAYLTKDKCGLIQLWNNKPELSKNKDIWVAWINKNNYKNEVAVDVTANDYFRHLFDMHVPPCCVDIELKYKVVSYGKHGKCSLCY